MYTQNRDALPYAARCFDNGAGRIYINRIVGDNAAYATADLFGNAVTDAASTALAERSPAGDELLRVDSGNNISIGDRLLLSDGPRSEYVTADSDPVAIGVALAGRLHAPQDGALAVHQQDPPVVGDNLTAEVTGDMDAGSALQLSDVAVAALTAGQVLRIQQTDDPLLIEYVTITNTAAAGFNEGECCLIISRTLSNCT